jgi:hypothetical protein
LGGCRLPVGRSYQGQIRALPFHNLPLEKNWRCTSIILNKFLHIPYLKGARFGSLLDDRVDTKAIGRGITVELSILVASLTIDAICASQSKQHNEKRTLDRWHTRVKFVPYPMSSTPAPHLPSTFDRMRSSAAHLQPANLHSEVRLT